MWVRNIIWCILLLGIVMLSILLFLFVMTPITDYQDTAPVQSMESDHGETQAANEGNKAVEGEEGGIIETPGQQGEALHQSSPSSKQKTEANPKQGKTVVLPIQEEKPTQEQGPPVEKAGGEPADGSMLYQIGQGIGYLAVIAALLPYTLFAVLSRGGRTAYRRSGRAGAHGLSFLSQLAVAVAALHGAIMLRLVENWNRHMLAGVWLFVLIVLFFLCISIYSLASSLRKNNPFSILMIGILLLFIIHTIG
ncbi:hypothetical protein [Aneurinibacillus thermoaerophilus]|uniref:Uncharacterized protein n=1 Tax=Aneurinibacillus thermoaerophilus TaxID=143495 RepID=A0A1G7XSB5_ANETH|nr:hypothetical protein [Aneurinibacillus thermoaerophilus]AMA73721.1 hypothetical protein ACH33_13195 [Aneurinibacillus sp. XH2]MED0677379.1 hypothetical protein [Aneurinibacillus thermoaerophilus]MED0737960.1 hypothetical protein [Aneurinibacillus thermoaerophilus]MED0756382.1 hypothetical protein [Aneurinibacillus thermoaerophilus]MED0761219.1 hypothetical protein [Aneurinibacillus thermoaerophilus]